MGYKKSISFRLNAQLLQAFLCFYGSPAPHPYGSSSFAASFAIITHNLPEVANESVSPDANPSFYGKKGGAIHCGENRTSNTRILGMFS